MLGYQIWDHNHAKYISGACQFFVGASFRKKIAKKLKSHRKSLLTNGKSSYFHGIHDIKTFVA